MGSAFIASAGDFQRAGRYVVTLPEFSGDYYSSGFPKPPVTVGAFNYTIPGDEVITSAVIAGQFGNSVTPTTAHCQVTLDGLVVVDSMLVSPNPYYNYYVSWSYSFLPSELGLLADGSAKLEAIQTSEYIIRLGETTLTMETQKKDVPEASTFVLFGLGALGLLGWKRRKKAA